MKSQTSKVQTLIIRKIEKEVKLKLAEKNSYKKRFKDILERSFIKIFLRVATNSKIQIKKYQLNSRFGCDEFGRDIEDGLNKYVKIIKSRGIKVHTVILLGSRAKGVWTPKSDVDVTIIASNLPKEGKNFLTRRLFNLKRHFVLSDRPLYMRIEPSGCCSKDEFIRRLKSLDIQVLDAVFYGQIIYDDGFWKTIKSEYKRIKRRYGLKNNSLKQLLLPL